MRRGLVPFLPSPKVLGPVVPSSPVSLLLSHPQDTAEYVAYVAKDPVNQRGEGAARVLSARVPLWRCLGSAQCRGGNWVTHKKALGCTGLRGEEP